MADWNTVLVCFVTLCILNASFCSADEPAECSRFDYEEKLLEKVIRLEMKLEKLESQTQGGKDCSMKTPNVAFRTKLSKDIGTVSKNHVIIFDEVDLNLGNAYNSRHGVFMAPFNGTYLFSMALGNPSGHPGAFFLKQNSQTIEYAIAGHTSGWNMGGVTTVAELVVGDDVWVEGEGYISGAYATIRYHTGFSGILIHSY